MSQPEKQKRFFLESIIRAGGGIFVVSIFFLLVAEASGRTDDTPLVVTTNNQLAFFTSFSNIPDSTFVDIELNDSRTNIVFSSQLPLEPSPIQQLLLRKLLEKTNTLPVELSQMTLNQEVLSPFRGVILAMTQNPTDGKFEIVLTKSGVPHRLIIFPKLPLVHTSYAWIDSDSVVLMTAGEDDYTVSVWMIDTKSMSFIKLTEKNIIGLQDLRIAQ